MSCVEKPESVKERALSARLDATHPPMRIKSAEKVVALVIVILSSLVGTTAPPAPVGIASLDEPAAELVLTRKCLDVAKVGYNLRCNGGRLHADLLGEFDVGLRGAVEATLGGAFKDE